MATLLPRQSIIQQAVEAKTTFSSWDACMTKTYCKWPAIVGIVVGCLIVFSLLWCISRCICCGKDLVCCCCRCCGREKGHKHLDSVPSTPYQGQYQSHGAPVYAGPGAFSQTATFDGATKVHADSLPAMPSWDTAASRKVEVVEEAAPESHEMDRLRTNASPAPRSDTTSPLARPIPMQDRAGSPYGSRTNLSNPGYGGGATAGAQSAGYGDDRYGSANPYGGSPRPPRSPGFAPSPASPYGPSTPSNDRYGASANPYGGSSAYGGTTAHESTNPYGGSSNAYGDNSGGYGGGSGGYGGNSGGNSGGYGNSNPYGGGGSNAYGGNSSAYNNNNRYGGSAANSSPYGQYNNSRPAGNGWRDI